MRSNGFGLSSSTIAHAPLCAVDGVKTMVPLGLVLEGPTTRAVLVPSRLPKKGGASGTDAWARAAPRPPTSANASVLGAAAGGMVPSGTAGTGGTVLSRANGLPSGPTSGAGTGQLAGGGHGRRNPDVGVTSWADTALPHRAMATANLRQWDRIGRSLSRPGRSAPQNRHIRNIGG